ncbi:MAG: glycoside hydrolase family protein [Proteobacteria bacterium]|nr:glycoside hydrolase family protein [Pseudomonadota bacterium]MBU1594833.1 glycoside hydrolase family protein [Pseudomonadota bacterium]
MNARRLSAELLRDEGLRLKPYRCPAGRLTIGVGRNLEDRGITEEEALVLLDNDIRSFWAQLEAALPWLMQAPEEVQEVLVNMCFNLGLAGLLRFTQTLAHLQAGRHGAAAAEMLRSRWAGQVGPRAERLAQKLREL